MQALVRQHFDGSPLKFVQWVDGQLRGAASFGGKDTWPGTTMPWLWDEDGAYKWPAKAEPTDSAVTRS